MKAMDGWIGALFFGLLVCAAWFWAGWLARGGYQKRPAVAPLVARGSLDHYAHQFASPPDQHTLYYLIPADSIEVTP